MRSSCWAKLGPLPSPLSAGTSTTSPPPAKSMYSREAPPKSMSCSAACSSRECSARCRRPPSKQTSLGGTTHTQDPTHSLLDNGSDGMSTLTDDTTCRGFVWRLHFWRTAQARQRFVKDKLYGSLRRVRICIPVSKRSVKCSTRVVESAISEILFTGLLGKYQKPKTSEATVMLNQR